MRLDQTLRFAEYGLLPVELQQSENCKLKSKNVREPMNNFEKLRDCKSISEMASFLAFTDLAEIIEVEQIIPDELFYKEWLGKEVEE